MASVTIAEFFPLVKTIPFLFTTTPEIKEKKILVNCSNHEFSGCKAKFTLISKNPENTMKVERPGKKAFFKMNHNLPTDVENWAVEPNSGNFQHSAYCRNQCPIEDRIYDFDIMNSRNSVEIRKEKNVNIRIFQKKPPFKKPLGMYTLDGVCILTNAKLVRRLPLGAHSIF